MQHSLNTDADMNLFMVKVELTVIFVKEVLLKNIAYLVFSVTACFPEKKLNLKLSETWFLAWFMSNLFFSQTLMLESVQNIYFLSSM